MYLSRSCFRFLSASVAGLCFLAAAPCAEAGNFQTLYTFTGKADGGTPVSLIRDAKGNLYGATTGGGAQGTGTIFKLTPRGKETVLYSFPSGYNPHGNLAMDAAGNLFGVTQDGGDQNYGTVFKVSPHGRETTIHSFTGGADGGYPYGGVSIDANGNLFGTTTEAFGYGSIFRIDPAGTFTTLYTFTGGNDGADPDGSLISDSLGNLYGTAHGGGLYQGGTIYKLASSGKFTLLYTFTQGNDGACPGSSLTLDSGGNLFGTTIQGGAYGFGTVFELTAHSKLKALHGFDVYTGDGVYPQGNLVQDLAGSLYGSVSQGGDQSSGDIFRVSLHGKFTIVHSFDQADGADPYGNVIADQQGNLYGTTSDGGAFNAGTVFRFQE